MVQVGFEFNGTWVPCNRCPKSTGLLSAKVLPADAELSMATDDLSGFCGALPVGATRILQEIRALLEGK